MSNSENNKDSEMVLTMKWLMADMMADIDIFLLMEEDQETDKVNKLFTLDEIRNQLMSTMKKYCNILKETGFDISQPLLTAIQYSFMDQLRRDYAKKHHIEIED